MDKFYLEYKNNLGRIDRAWQVGNDKRDAKYKLKAKLKYDIVYIDDMLRGIK